MQEMPQAENVSTIPLGRQPKVSRKASSAEPLVSAIQPPGQTLSRSRGSPSISATSSSGTCVSEVLAVPPTSLSIRMHLQASKAIALSQILPLPAPQLPLDLVGHQANLQEHYREIQHRSISRNRSEVWAAWQHWPWDEILQPKCCFGMACPSRQNMRFQRKLEVF